MASIQLRDYQLECVDAVWQSMFKKNHILVCLPTGTGKTECFIELCRRAIEKKLGVRILIVMDQTRLVSQTAKRIGPQAGVFCSALGRREINNNITVASIQSIYNEPLEAFDIVIIDEVHKFTLEGRYRVLMHHLKELKNTLKVIGFTATPFRATGHIYGKGQFFEEIDYKRSLQWAIHSGYLTKPVMKNTPCQFDTSNLSLRLGDFDNAELSKLVEDESKVSDQIKDALPRLHGRKHVVWATTNITHAEMVHAKLEHAAIIHSKQSKEEQDFNLYNFESGISRHLVFVSMVNTGYDYPPLDAIVLMRPTRSPVLYVQTVGRGLRLFEGKKDCLILDYGRVVANCGTLDNPRIPKKGERKGEVVSTGLKACPQCLSFIPTAVMVCPDCGYEFPAPDPVKNLTRTHGTGSLLQNNDPIWVAVSGVSLAKHQSKAGNSCLKVTYHGRNVLSQDTLSEFFIWSNEWARRKGQNRLRQLGIPPYDTIDEVLTKSALVKIPAFVKYVFENKYRKVLDISFDRKADGIADIASTEFDPRGLGVEE